MEFDLALRALIQGITEFLPISSAGHLALLPYASGLSDKGVGLDVALHGGTLLAVLVYFWRDVARALSGSADILRAQKSEARHFALLLLIATLPALITGGILFLSDVITALRAVEIIAWANIIFAVPLYLADKYGGTHHSIKNLTYGGALVIGLAQCFALIPGASRSGTTLMAARALHLPRQEAARFSMLLAIPIIAAFALIHLGDLILADERTALIESLLAGALAALVAFFTIHFFLRLLARISLLPFVLYRLALGGALLYGLYFL